MKRKRRIIIFSVIGLLMILGLVISIRVFMIYQQIPKLIVKVVNDYDEPIENVYVHIPFKMKFTNSDGICKFIINEFPVYLKVFYPKMNQHQTQKIIEDIKLNESLEVNVVINTSSNYDVLLSVDQIKNLIIESGRDYFENNIPYFSLFQLSQIDDSILLDSENFYKKEWIISAVKSQISYNSLQKDKKQKFLEKLEIDSLDFDDLIELSNYNNYSLIDTILTTDVPNKNLNDLINKNETNPLEKLLICNEVFGLQKKGFTSCYIEYPIIYNDNKCIFRIIGEFGSGTYVVEILNKTEIRITMIESSRF